MAFPLLMELGVGGELKKKLTTVLFTALMVFSITYPSLTVVAARAMLVNSTAANPATQGTPTPTEHELQILRHAPVKLGAKALKLAKAKAAAAAARAPSHVQGVFQEPDDYLASLLSHLSASNSTNRRHLSQPMQPVPVEIRPAHTGFTKCLDVPYGNPVRGVALWNWYCNDNQAQEFYIFYSGYEDGTFRNLYSIQTGLQTRTSKCVDVLRPSTNTLAAYRGQPLITWDCLYTDNQQYVFEYSPDYSFGVYKIKPVMFRTKSQCVGVRGGDKVAGAGYLDWDCNGHADQKFWIRAKR